jgi:predicted nucleic acid-binding Zn ribbon protein
MVRYTKRPARKRPRSELIPIGDVLTSLMTDGTLPYRPDDVEIWRVWKEVVGETYAENSQPSKIRKKQLTVTVSNSIWLQELTFYKETILEKLNLKLGRKAVDKINIRVGSR